MADTPLVRNKKYNTLELSERINKPGQSTLPFRRTDRRSTSVVHNPEATLSATMPMFQENISLPKIADRKRVKKQGGFLESWLDEALGSPDPMAPQPTENTDKVQSNVLKTLRKFDLDKRYLQSQNIPAERVERLYQSLYIYSHGINKVFEQLLKFVQETQNNDLMNNFWRAYTKLLQGCTSYQTVFQRVEKSHLENIYRLKHTLESKTEGFAEQRKELQQKLRKSSKVIEQKQQKYNQLKIEYDVLQTTLNLTDEAFNDEVHLRLKFEQKINAVYTSYEELKSKYTKLVEEVGIRNSDLVGKESLELDLKNKLLVERTKVDELMFLLKSEKEKTAQREADLAIRSQEIQELKAQILARTTDEEQTQEQMEEHLSKYKALKMKLLQAENVLKGQRITIKQQQQYIAKLNKLQQEYKQHNTETYDKYWQSSKKIVEQQSALEQKSLQILSLQSLILKKQAETGDLTRELEHSKNLLANLQHEHSILEKNYRDTKQTMAKNNALMEEMKAVKDKYERINDILKEELKVVESANSKLIRDFTSTTQEAEGLKLLLENRNKTLVQIEKQVEQEKELNKTRVAGLQMQITKKQSFILDLQKKKEHLELEFNEFKAESNRQKDKLILLESLKMKAQVELNSKNKLLSEIESTLATENTKYRSLNDKFEGEMKQKFDISSQLQTTQYVLSKKSQGERVQILGLSGLLQEYKGRLLARAQHVHPMVYEEALEVARRSVENEGAWKTRVRNLQVGMEKLAKEKVGVELEAERLRNRVREVENNISLAANDKTQLIERVKLAEDKLAKVEQRQRKSLADKQSELQSARNQCSRKENQKRELEARYHQTIRQKENIIENMQSQIKLLSELQQKAKQQRAEIIPAKPEHQAQKHQQQAQTQAFQPGPPSPQAQTAESYAQTQSGQQQIPTHVSEVLEPVYEHSRQQEKGETKLRPEPRKVETKEFKKALKLTYMRR